QVASGKLLRLRMDERLNNALDSVASMRGRTNALQSYPNPPIVEALSEPWERNREALRLSDRPLSGNHGRAVVSRRPGTVKNPLNKPPRTRRGNCWLASDVTPIRGGGASLGNGLAVSDRQ